MRHFLPKGCFYSPSTKRNQVFFILYTMLILLVYEYCINMLKFQHILQATKKYLSIGGCNGIFQFGLAGHCHESKTTGTTSLSVINYTSLHHLTMFTENLFQTSAVQIPWQVTNVHSKSRFKHTRGPFWP